MVRPNEEYPNVVVLPFFQLMHRERVRSIGRGDKIFNLAIGVARDILERGHARRFLVEPLNGYDGENLIDGPRVGQRLEKRTVAKVLIRKHLIEDS